MNNTQISSRKNFKDAYNVEIPKRPPKTWFQLLHGVLFLVVYLSGCIMINAFQFLFLLPLAIMPAPFTWLYKDGVRYTKGCFGKLCVLACQYFAPTTLVVTFERDINGRFTDDDIKRILIKDKNGEITGLKLPEKSVLIANHQIYADWLYLWCLGYFSNFHKDITIVLKKSFKWVPIVGWGMQFLNFIFLARSWAVDRVYFANKLSSIGRDAQNRNNPFAFIIYPEGNLVSAHTREISKKYADKLEIPDTKHTILPRSTGLLYTLRSLSPQIPDLKLLDITVVYPGIPPMGSGQSYYTLRSIFMDRIPPPAIHLHIRLFNVTHSVPIGDLSKTDGKAVTKGKNMFHTKSPEVNISEDEHRIFDEWLRNLWMEKDDLISNYHSTGSISTSDPILFPIRLRKIRDILDAFCFFSPVLIFLAFGWYMNR